MAQESGEGEFKEWALKGYRLSEGKGDVLGFESIFIYLCMLTSAVFLSCVVYR